MSTPWNIDENYWPGPYEQPPDVIIRVHTAEGTKSVPGSLDASGRIISLEPVVLKNGDTLTINSVHPDISLV